MRGRRLLWGKRTNQSFHELPGFQRRRRIRHDFLVYFVIVFWLSVEVLPHVLDLLLAFAKMAGLLWLAALGVGLARAGIFRGWHSELGADPERGIVVMISRKKWEAERYGFTLATLGWMVAVLAVSWQKSSVSGFVFFLVFLISAAVFWTLILWAGRALDWMLRGFRSRFARSSFGLRRRLKRLSEIQQALSEAAARIGMPSRSLLAECGLAWRDAGWPPLKAHVADFESRGMELLREYEELANWLDSVRRRILMCLAERPDKVRDLAGIVEGLDWGTMLSGRSDIGWREARRAIENSLLEIEACKF